MTAHEAEEMKGRVKEAVGDITGDEALKREGKIDQATATTKDAVDAVAAKAKEVLNPKK